jgi:NAD(P)-dependent dehydrogenase (short-subunit alcohol dehydrogenase family)
MGRLNGKVAIISGAARGIGRAIAETFAAEGASVLAGDVVTPSAPSAGVDRMDMDVTREDAWRRVVERAEADYGRLDVLVNNAGISEYEAIHDVTMGSWRRIVAVNQTGVWLGMRAAVPAMRRCGGGSIINVSSILGAAAIPGEHVYHATKGAVLSMTRNAAVTYARANIRANAILPGWIRTPMTEAQEPALNEAFIASTPMAKGGEPEDVANGALFLASDDSRYVTGVELPVDGGYLAQAAPLTSPVTAGTGGPR